MVYPGTLFHRRQRGIPMQSYENRSQIRALRASSLCTTAHPLYTRCTYIFGASIFEPTMLPSPTPRCSPGLRPRCWLAISNHFIAPGVHRPEGWQQLLRARHGAQQGEAQGGPGGAPQPPGPLPTRLHTAYAGYSECLPTLFGPLAERARCPQAHNCDSISPLTPDGLGAGPLCRSGHGSRLISECHFAVQPNHFTPGVLS